MVPVLRFPALPAWSRTVVVLITAAMSGCRGKDLIGSVNAAPMRLASPKSFIDGLGKDAVNDAIVRLIVDFAHTLGLKVTAGGVENDRQVETARQRGGRGARGDELFTGGI